MKTNLAHLQINVRRENLPYYRELMGFLGWRTLLDEENILGVAGDGPTSLWLYAGETNDARNDYDGAGMNHLAVGAETPADVDAAAGYLREHGIAALFETPRHRPEFAGGEDQTYYQVMFETPDRILVEVVYQGPK